MFNRRLSIVLILSIFFVLSGCESLSYYSQAAKGQMSLLLKRQKITPLLADTDNNLSPRKQRQLALVLEIRQFAEQQLQLPVGKAYESYADITNPYVVWNVFSADPLSVEAKQWCYPIIGCASYRGYFNEQAAQQYADKMQRQGLETYVAGVRAYSTLGWFNDPVLSTFLDYSDIDLAALLFHELAHRVIYIPGDTDFNESFATAIELAGVEYWFHYRSQTANETEHAALQQQLGKYKLRQQTQKLFVELVAETRHKLSAIYSDPIYDEQTKLRLKSETFEQLVNDIDLFAQQRSAALDVNSHDKANTVAVRHFYSNWSKDINNAKLLPVNSYYRWLPAISQQLDRQFNTFSCQLEQENRSKQLDFLTQAMTNNCRQAMLHFYQTIDALKAMQQSQRDALLTTWGE